MSDKCTCKSDEEIGFCERPCERDTPARAELRPSKEQCYCECTDGDPNACAGWHGWQDEPPCRCMCHQPTHEPATARMEILPVTVDGEPDAHLVRFHVGNQGFSVGPEYWNTKAEAEWYADMFMKAIHRATPPPSPDAPKFKVGDRVALNFGRNHLDQGEIYVRKLSTTYKISCNGVDVAAWYEEHELAPYSASTKGDGHE